MFILKAILWLHHPPSDLSEWSFWSGGSAAEHVQCTLYTELLNAVEEAGQSCLHIAASNGHPVRCKVIPSQVAHCSLCVGQGTVDYTALCSPKRAPGCNGSLSNCLGTNLCTSLSIECPDWLKILKQ